MDRTRVISTVAIWVAAAVIFVGGFARMSWSGMVGGLVWASGVGALFLAVGYATKTVWASEKRADGQEADRDDA